MKRIKEDKWRREGKKLGVWIIINIKSQKKRREERNAVDDLPVLI